MFDKFFNKIAMPDEQPRHTTQLDYINHTGHTVLKGRFGLRFVREIGSGYAGTVYKCLRTRGGTGLAQDKATGGACWLAVKLMYKKKIKGEAAEREARLLSMSSGSGVVEYLGAVECVDAYLLVTEYCSQGDLHSLLPFLDQGNVMARDYLRGVSAGLERLHDMLIAHGDVKMRNIVVDGNNVPKLADFGFATLLAHRRAKTSVCQGTKDYWAPEMWAASPYYSPFQADVYALGVTFLGVCERRPIKRKDNDLVDIINNIKNPQQKALFSGLLEGNPRQRAGLDVVQTNPWMAASLTPPPSP